MATTTVTFGKIAKDFPAIIASSFVSETITPTSSNQQTTVTAPIDTLKDGNIVANVATDVQVYVTFGANPNALTSTAARKMIPAGGDVYFVVNGGDECAVTLAP